MANLNVTYADMQDGARRLQNVVLQELRSGVSRLVKIQRAAERAVQPDDSH